MFSGIIQGTGRISRIEDMPGLRWLEIQMEDLTKGLHSGASVAVNGVCLTVVCVENQTVSFEVISESLKCTNLGSLKPENSVNIERSMRYKDEIGGHQVTGHIDVTGKINKIELLENNFDMQISCETKWTAYLIPKGWIAVDGISLTVVDVGPNWFTVSLIPETLERTLMGQKHEEDTVNLEFDHTTKVVVQTIERLFPDLGQRLLSKIKK